MKSTTMFSAALLWTLAGCAAPATKPSHRSGPDSVAPSGGKGAARLDTRPTILYIGSSTIANFIREAEPVYGKVHFILDTIPESAGGERAIQEGYGDLGGVAMEPEEDTIRLGVRATPIGTDTIAILVNSRNPVNSLTLSQLRGIFTGKIRSWKELGGQDLPILPLIVGPRSATGVVFRAQVLSGEDFSHFCRVVTPDPDMPMNVEAEPAAIGTISFSFTCSGGEVKVIQVDRQPPIPSNLDYPIVRPLYLLYRPENTLADQFVAWTVSPEGEKVITKCFDRPRLLPRRAPAPAAPEPTAPPQAR